MEETKKIKLVYYDSILNFGDLLSPYIIGELSNKKITHKNAYYGIKKTIKLFVKNLITFNYKELNKMYYPYESNLLGVGSIISWGNKHSKVWGSGFMNESEHFHGGKIYAVRGKETNNKLLKEGFAGCDVFGDPALLLPLIVKGTEDKKYELGIVPHWTETDYFLSKYSSQYKIIDLRTSNIEKVISDITSCKYILSTSLHGIIVSHAYNIPALWIKKGFIHTDGFKFRDYFSSVNICNYEGHNNIGDLLSSKSSWESYFKENIDKSLPQIDLFPIQQNLLKAAPFTIVDKFANILR